LEMRGGDDAQGGDKAAGEKTVSEPQPFALGVTYVGKEGVDGLLGEGDPETDVRPLNEGVDGGGFRPQDGVVAGGLVGVDGGGVLLGRERREEVKGAEEVGVVPGLIGGEEEGLKGGVRLVSGREKKGGW
jgi:hypothetical protein